MTAQTAGATWWKLSEWEFREAVRRTREAKALPKGSRADAYRRIASDYGVSVRTLERWLGYDLRTVRCGKYEALFVIGKKRPSQVTPWERAA